MRLYQDSQKYVKLQWKQKLYQFLCLCFGLASIARVFIKLVKVPIAVLKRLNILPILYIDDTLLIATSHKELITARDTLIFLLKNLGFLINFEKSVLHPCKMIEIFGSCELQRYDNHFSTGESKCNNRSVLAVSLKRSSDSAGNCSTDWETKLLCSRSSVSTPALQVPNKGNKFWNLQWKI